MRRDASRAQNLRGVRFGRDIWRGVAADGRVASSGPCTCRVLPAMGKAGASSSSGVLCAGGGIILYGGPKEGSVWPIVEAHADAEEKVLLGPCHEYYGFPSFATEDDVIDVFAAAKLDEVCLSMFPQSTLLVPWSRLTRFEGHRNSVEDVLDVLWKAPQLVECTLTSAIDVGGGTQLPAVHLPRLRALTLSKTATPIDHLVLPVLETLVLRMSEDSADDNDEDADDFYSDEVDGT